MRVNFDSQDGLIMVSGDRRGVWASQVLIKGSKTIRTGGQLPTTASRHTLQLVALTSALRSITKADAARITPRGVSKARLLVTSIDSSFLDALQAETPLRAGRNFFTIAMQQLARFDLTFAAPEDGDMTVHMLSKWAANHVFPPKNIPAVLIPSAVSQVI